MCDSVLSDQSDNETGCFPVLITNQFGFDDNFANNLKVIVLKFSLETAIAAEEDALAGLLVNFIRWH